MKHTNSAGASELDATTAQIMRSVNAENPLWEELKRRGIWTPNEAVLTIIPELESVHVRTPQETRALRDRILASSDEIFEMQRRGLLNGRAQSLALAAMVINSAPKYHAKLLSTHKTRQLEELAGNLGINLHYI